MPLVQLPWCSSTGNWIYFRITAPPSKQNPREGHYIMSYHTSFTSLGCASYRACVVCFYIYLKRECSGWAGLRLEHRGMMGDEGWVGAELKLSLIDQMMKASWVLNDRSTSSRGQHCDKWNGSFDHRHEDGETWRTVVDKKM